MTAIAMSHSKVAAEDWLRSVMFSGEVSGIAQHLAIAIYSLSKDSGNAVSLKTLEHVTGWNRQTLRNHLAELDGYVSIVQLSSPIGQLPFSQDEALVQVLTGSSSKAALRVAAVDAFGHSCSHCGRIGAREHGPDNRPWCLDRIIPGAVGGTYVADNVTLSCWDCNAKRGASPIEKRIFSLKSWLSLQAEWVDVGAAFDSLEAGHA